MSIYRCIAFLFFYLLPLAEFASAQGDPYLVELITRSRELKLSDHRYWHLLLHYRPRLAGGVESEADEAGFFLAAEGKFHPQAELEATLAAFFSAESVGRSKQAPRCAFIARFDWLREQLNIDGRRLPVQRCDRYEEWLKELNPDSITLIFPSAYMNNPSSMFGHLLLRVDQKGQTEPTSLLAYTINYAADVTSDNGIVFAVLGVTGGFKGYFSTHPYYIKAKEYGDFENRDIWEYKLNLAPRQIDRLLMHAWEMGNASYDYFFFKENCAYHILALIELAAPDAKLTERYWFYTFPTDGVRALTEKPGLVEKARFRPSRRTKIRRGFEELTNGEQGHLYRIVRSSDHLTSPAFTSLAAERRAKILDVASDYLLYKGATETDSKSYLARNQQILLARSGIRTASPKVDYLPFAGPPDAGHEIKRAGLGIGWRDGDFFNQWDFRLAYHDLMDPGYGYTPDAQIEALGVTLRRYAANRHTRIERFTLLNILSLSPIDPLFASPSWKLNSGLETVELHGCNHCRIADLSGGIGAAMESRLFEREVYFAFADVALQWGRILHGNHRVGTGGAAGVYLDLTERWKILLAGQYVNFSVGDRGDRYEFKAEQRFTITRDWSVRVNFNQQRRGQEYLLNVNYYF